MSRGGAAAETSAETSAEAAAEAAAEVAAQAAATEAALEAALEIAICTQPLQLPLHPLETSGGMGTTDPTSRCVRCAVVDGTQPKVIEPANPLPVSPAARHLLGAMLDKDPSERMALADVARSDWVRDPCGAELVQ